MLEVCVDSFESVKAAIDGGIYKPAHEMLIVELCKLSYHHFLSPNELIIQVPIELNFVPH